jgi:hypothetical protein
MLRQSEGGSLSQTTLSRAFMRDPIKRQAVIDDLQELGLASVVRVGTGGRPRTELRLVDGDFGAFRAFKPMFYRPLDADEPDPRSPNGAKGAPKGHESPTEGTPKSTEGWRQPCRDYVSHQTRHRRTPLGWACLACHPEEEAT